MKNSSWRKISFTLILILIISSTFSVAAANPKPPKPTPVSASIEIEADLAQSLDQTNRASYMIYFREEPDLSAAYDMPWDERGWYVINALQETAQRSQKSVRAALDSQGIKYQSFWIDNIIVVEESSADMVNSLMSFPEIEALRTRRNPVLFTPDERSPAPEPNGIESNLTHIHADDVWGLGYTGEGIVVANIDTGVRYTHQALINQYRGNLGGGSYNHNYNWWDPYLHSTTPSDSDDHGSHTMGTMIGDDGGSNQIGMAPGAEWIACKSFSGGDVDAQLLECGEFMLAPWDLTGSNPNPNKRPNVINNSWGDCERSYDDGWYADVIDSWLAAGIYPVFSNGNASNCHYSEPPGLNTVGNPARYGNVTGVGATGRNNGEYATYSNWGPTDNADTVNPRGYPTLKPQVVAPGTNRSAYKTSDTSYGSMSGTSMAAPHVAGLIALMWSAAPCLVGDYATTETIIEETANPIPYDDGTGGGAHTPNNATGWGEIDALAAVQAAIESCPFTIEPDPDSLGVCVPDNAQSDLSITQVDPSFTESVTLSTTGVPTGYTPSFSDNPVIPTDSSMLTFIGSPAAVYGSHSISIIGAATTSTNTARITLNLFTTTPGDIALSSPSDGSNEVALQPTFSWQSATQAGSYTFELASDPEFNHIVATTNTNRSSYKPSIILEQLSTYYWRVTPSNACATGNTSTVFSFTTLETAPILLVDDDDNDPDVSAYFTSILDTLGYAYNVWDTENTDNEPSETELLPYEMVIWFTGSYYGSYAGPSTSAENALARWLLRQNCLFISSQDYHWNRGLTSFMTNYLGVSSITDDSGYYTSVSGKGSLFSGFGPFTLTYPFHNYSDIINPNSAAEVALRGNNSNNAAIDKDVGLYRTTYWAFPFETLSESARQESMQKIVNWCNTMPVFDNFIILPIIHK